MTDDFVNRLEGPLGWTDSLDLDTLGTLVRLGIITHTHTLARKVRIRTFRVGQGLPYEVNADAGIDPALIEQVQG